MLAQSVVTFVFLIVVRPAVSLTCYQQVYTPGISNTNQLGNQNSFGSPGYNQQQQQYANYGQLALPSITCSATASSCFKFVCFGSTPYTIKGCLDVAQPQYTCQAMDAQCLGGQGNCFICSGNNCNGAISIHGNPARLVALFMAISVGAYMLKNLA